MKYAKLRGLIREQYGQQAKFARALDISTATLSAKLCGRRDWTRQEVQLICMLLGIQAKDIPSIFFAP